MRPSFWMILMVFVVVAAGIRAHSSNQPSTLPPALIPPPSPWIVEGTWMETQEEAIESALQSAQSKVATYLRSKDPSLEWSLPTDFIRTHMLMDLRAEDVPPEETRVLRPILDKTGRQMLAEERFLDPPLGNRHQVSLKVVLNRDNYGMIQRLAAEERQQRRQLISEQRQLFLAKGLAVLVAVLAALVGYVRLEEATKGYYTGWLRLAAVGLVAAVVVGLILAA